METEKERRVLQPATLTYVNTSSSRQRSTCEIIWKYCVWNLRQSFQEPKTTNDRQAVSALTGASPRGGHVHPTFARDHS